MKQSLFLIFFFILLCSSSIGQVTNNVLHFDGNNDFVRIDPLATQMNNFSTFSVEFWIKTTSTGSHEALFAINSVATVDNGLLIMLRPNGVLGVSDLATWIPHDGTTIINDGICHHIAYVRNGNSATTYVDGVQEVTGISTNFSIHWSNKVSIGQEWDNLTGSSPIASNFFEGTIDELRIWSKALTVAEINAGMNIQMTGVEPNLTALYGFDQGIANGNNSALLSVTNASPLFGLNGQLNNFGLMGGTSNFINLSCLIPPVIVSDSVCSGECLTLTTQSLTTMAPVSVQWLNGIQSSADSVQVCPTTDSIFTAVLTDNFGNTDTNIFNINVHAFPVVDLGNDMTICTGDSLALFNQVSLSNYLWQNNTTDSSLVVNQAGTYWLESTFMSCTSLDSITIALTPLPQVNLGNDSVLCEFETLNLNASIFGGTYLWNDGSTLSNLLVSSPGQYWVEVTTNGCSKADTIDISYRSVSTNIGNDTAVCGNILLHLNAYQPQATYQWQNNATDSVFVVSQPGTYFVDLTLNGCLASDTIVVSHLPTPMFNLGQDTIICSNDILMLESNLTGVNHSWQDGSSSSSFLAEAAGWYWLEVDNGICSVVDSISIFYLPISADLGHDFSLCTNESVTLDVSQQGATYLWSDLSTGGSLQVHSEGLYHVQVTNGSCTASDTVVVEKLTPVTLSFPVFEPLCARQSFEFLHNGPVAAIASFNWSFSDGQTSKSPYPKVTFDTPGQTTINLVVISNEGCTSSFNSSIDVLTAPTAAFNFTPTNPFIDIPVAFTNQSSNYNEIAWHFEDVVFQSSENLDYTFTDYGLAQMFLVAKNGLCEDTAFADIEIKEELIYYVPNAFLIGSQTVAFKPVFTSGYHPYNYKLTIFNRWGEVIFVSFDAEIGWDGMYSGSVVQDGTYIWQIDFLKNTTDESITERGTVTVLN